MAKTILEKLLETLNRYGSFLSKALINQNQNLFYFLTESENLSLVEERCSYKNTALALSKPRATFILT